MARGQATQGEFFSGLTSDFHPSGKAGKPDRAIFGSGNGAMRHAALNCKLAFLRVDFCAPISP